MRLRSLTLLSIFTLSLSFVALPAHAQLTAFTSTLVGSARNLSTLTANGTVYNVASLVGVSLSHYNSTLGTPFNNVFTTGAAPAVGTRAGLLTDIALNTGLSNIGNGTGFSGAFTSTTPGINVVFNTPIQNRPGVDVILFEIGTGDPVRVTRSNVTGAGQSAIFTSYSVVAAGAASFTTYEMTRTPTAGNTNANGAATLAELQANPITANSANSQTQDIRGIGIDLSALGYTDGQFVSSLFFQATTAPTTGVDPSLIVGLPAVVPEAGTFALALPALGMVGMLLKRRRAG